LNKNTERNYALSAAKAFGTNHNLYQSTTVDYLRGFLQAISAVEETSYSFAVCHDVSAIQRRDPQSSDIVVNAQGPTPYLECTYVE